VVYLAIFKTPNPRDEKGGEGETGRKSVVKQHAKRRGCSLTIESNGMYDFTSARVRRELRMLILNQREVNMGCFRFRRRSPGIQLYDFFGRFAKGRYANPTCPKISRAKPSRVNYTACLICVYKINWYDFARERNAQTYLGIIFFLL